VRRIKRSSLSSWIVHSESSGNGGLAAARVCVRIVLVLAPLVLAVLLTLPVVGHDVPKICDESSVATYSMTAVMGFIVLEFISPLLEQLLRNRSSRSMKLKAGQTVLIVAGDICDLDRGRELCERVIQLTSSKSHKRVKTRRHERFEKANTK
jgi:hypothetical protein